MRTFKFTYYGSSLKPEPKTSRNMASVLTLALALALKHFHSSIFLYSSAVNGDVYVCRVKLRLVSEGAEPFVSFGR